MANEVIAQLQDKQVQQVMATRAREKWEAVGDPAAVSFVPALQAMMSLVEDGVLSATAQE